MTYRAPRKRCAGADCRAPIAMVPTGSGKPMPLDDAPNPAGNVVIDHDLLQRPYAVVLGPDDAQRARDAGRQLFMPHHATCPNADQFRAHQTA